MKKLSTPRPPREPTLIEVLAAQVRLHAARRIRHDPVQLVIFTGYTLGQVERTLTEARCQDLPEALRLFREIGEIILNRWRGLNYVIETAQHGAAA